MIYEAVVPGYLLFLDEDMETGLVTTGGLKKGLSDVERRGEEREI